MIYKFTEEYSFLSNFWPVEIEVDGLIYPSVENAYQASKAQNEEDKNKFLSKSAGQAKRLGRAIAIRKDWEDKKYSIMLKLNRQKFKNPELLKKLLDTGLNELVEGNNWNDVYWGKCNGLGENNLGKILMKIREENRREIYTKFRSWNEDLKAFIYFEDGKYFTKTETKIMFINPINDFDWSKAEQSTKWEDRDGVEIYSGDFVLAHGKGYNCSYHEQALKGLVFYSVEDTSFLVDCGIQKEGRCKSLYPVNSSLDFRVVGNIHENKYLFNR